MAAEPTAPQAAPAAAEPKPSAPAPSRTKATRYVALVNIRNGSDLIEIGDVLPFDPTKDEAGTNGFVEGEHYRRA